MIIKQDFDLLVVDDVIFEEKIGIYVNNEFPDSAEIHLNKEEMIQLRDHINMLLGIVVQGIPVGDKPTLKESNE